MPLNTQIIRNGEPLKLPWRNFHVAAMALAAAFDAKDGPLGDMTKIYENVEHVHPYMPFPIASSLAFQISTYHVLAVTPLNSGGYVLKHGHSFIDLSDGEVFELLPGDELVAYRGW